MVWQLQDAKNRFSEVVDRALSEGAQTITRHGKQTAVVISADEYRAFRAKKGGLAAFFASAPRADLEITRGRDGARSVEL
jgi:prevent-host-death family protein